MPSPTSLYNTNIAVQDTPGIRTGSHLLLPQGSGFPLHHPALGPLDLHLSLVGFVCSVHPVIKGLRAGELPSLAMTLRLLQRGLHCLAAGFG
jgi:hypothetical protein